MLKTYNSDEEFIPPYKLMRKCLMGDPFSASTSLSFINLIYFNSIIDSMMSGDIFNVLSCFRAQINLFMTYKSQTSFPIYFKMSVLLKVSRIVGSKHVASACLWALLSLRQLSPKPYFDLTSIESLPGIVKRTFPVLTTYRQFDD